MLTSELNLLFPLLAYCVCQVKDVKLILLFLWRSALRWFIVWLCGWMWIGLDWWEDKKNTGIIYISKKGLNNLLR